MLVANVFALKSLIGPKFELYCTLKIMTFVSRLTLAMKSWTRMEHEILVNMHAPCKSFSSFWFLKTSESAKQNFSHLSLPLNDGLHFIYCSFEY